MRRNTLLVEQRNVDGKIIGGQKVRGFHPRAIDLLDPVAATCVNTCSLTESAKGCSSRAETASPGGYTTTRTGADGLAFGASQGWDRGLPPYDLRHAFASLQIRAGMSIPELAEQMGHSPQMTVGTYTHVIRELKGQPIMAAEGQIEQARRALEEERDAL